MRCSLKLISGLALCSTLLLSAPASADVAGWDNAMREGTVSFRQGKYAAAEQFFRDALTQAGEFSSPDARLAQTYNDLALSLQSQRKWEEAEKTYKQAIAMRQELATAEPLGMLPPMRNLASLYAENRQFELAEQTYKEALELAEKNGPGSDALAQTLNEFALFQNRRQKYDEAVLLIKRAIEISEKRLGANSPAIAILYNNLGELYGVQAKFDQSIEAYTKALDIRTANQDAVGMASTAGRLGALYKDAGQDEKAEPFLQQSLAAIEKLGGADQSGLVIALNNLALVYRDQGKYEQAAPLYERVLKIRQQSFDRSVRDVVAAMANIGDLQVEQTKYAEAEQTFENALKMLESSFGQNSEEVAGILLKMTDVYRDSGQLPEAEARIKRAVSILQGGSSQNNASIAAALTDLALLYREENKLEEAEVAARQSVEQWRLARGQSPEAANALHNLAKLQAARREYKAAEASYREALDLRRKTLGENDLSVAATMRNYALLLQELKRFKEADLLNTQASAIERRAAAASLRR